MRMIIILGGVAMAASFFMAWLEFPFAGPSLSPVSVFTDGDFNLLGGDDWRSWVFLGGFTCAALAVVMAVIGSGGGLTALLAGAAPLIILGHLWVQSDDLRTLLEPLPITYGDIGQVAQVMGDFARVGLWAYIGSSVILLVAGLSQLFGRR